MNKYTKQYLDMITRLFNTIENEEQEAIDRATVIIAESIMKDQLIHVVGTGGHSNIAAERQLRPKVIMRKITFGNRSSSSALNQAVMMSIIQTGILNEIEPLNILLALSVKPLTSFTELPKIRSP